MVDGERKENWEIFRKNIKFIRKHYNLTQQEVANGVGCSRGSYQHAESNCPSGISIRLMRFWYKRYSITPNDLLLSVIDEERMEKIEKRISFAKPKRKLIVRVKDI